MKILRYDKKEVNGCEINYLQIQISDIEEHANGTYKNYNRKFMDRKIR